MSQDIYEQILRIPPAQLVDLALAGLHRQGQMVARAIDCVQKQLGQVLDAASAKRIYLAGCGDSFFAALSARYAFDQLTGLPTVALESMELAHYTLLPPESLVIVISSGGEAAATIEAGRAAKRAGTHVVGITASEDSPMAQELPCLISIPGLAGSDPVEGVSTILSNFSLSLTTLYLTAVHISQHRGHLNSASLRKIESEIRAIPDAIERATGCSAEVLLYLEHVSDKTDLYFVGAGPSYGAALFYQAKLFEQVRRPVYGVELEEFAHEQFYLLRPGRDAHVWFIAPPGRSRERTLEIIAGCREMGAHTVAVVDLGDVQIRQQVNLAFSVEIRSEMLSPLVSIVPGELLAIRALADWTSGSFSASNRRRQIAINRQLTRERRGKP